MDQQINDQSIVSNQYHEQQNSDTDLLNAIVGGTQANNQLDCTIDSNIQ